MAENPTPPERVDDSNQPTKRGASLTWFGITAVALLAILLIVFLLAS